MDIDERASNAYGFEMVSIYRHMQMRGVSHARFHQVLTIRH